MGHLFRILNNHKLVHGNLPIRLNFLDNEGFLVSFSAAVKVFKKCIKKGLFSDFKFIGVYE